MQQARRLLALVLLVAVDGSALGGRALAQQGLCSRKVRHITCHFPDGTKITYDTDASAEFYNSPPYMTFRTKDGDLHAIIGGCEIVCHP